MWARSCASSTSPRPTSFTHAARDDAGGPRVSCEDQLEKLSLHAPGLDRTEWNTLETGVIDPFGNLIRFCEPLAPEDVG
jgi:hypothetical protein